MKDLVQKAVEELVTEGSCKGKSPEAKKWIAIAKAKKKKAKKGK